MGDIERLQLRVSDADRHRVAEVLREAAGEGRLDLEELDQRLEIVFRAKTYGDLVPVTADLPTTAMPVDLAKPVAAPHPTAPVPAEPQRHLAILSGFERKGVWTVPPVMGVTAVLGGAQLDLREATFTSTTTELHLNVVLGGVNVVVPPQVRVIFSMTAILGGYSDSPGELATPESPTLVIKGLCLLGGVAVERKK